MFVVVVEHKPQPVAEKSQIHTEIKLCGSLPLQGRIRHGGRQQCSVPVVRAGRECAVCIVKPDAVVTGLSVGGAQLEGVGRLLGIAPERFLRNDPCHRTGREIAPLIADSKFGGPVGTKRSRNDVTVVIIVRCPREIGDHRLLLVLIARREDRTGAEHRHIVRRSPFRIGFHLPVILGHILITAGNVQRMHVAERLVVIEMSRKDVPDGLFAGFGGVALQRDVIGSAVALSVGIITSPVGVVEIVVLRESRQSVGDVPFESERPRSPVDGLLAVVERLVPSRTMGIAVGAQLTPVAVVVEFARRGCGYDASADGLIVVVDERMLFLARQVERSRRLQILRNLERRAAVQGEDLVAAHRNHAVVAVITDRRGIFQFVGSPVYTDVLLVPECVGEPLRLPVGIGEDNHLVSIQRIVHPLITCRDRLPVIEITGRIVGIRRRVSRTVGIGTRKHGLRIVLNAVRIGFADNGTKKTNVFAGIHEIPFARRRRTAQLEVEHDLGALCQRTFFGRDQNYAVGCPSAVDTGRCCVLEHLHRLDVVRIDTGQVLAQSPVHDVDRIITHRDGRSAANHHAGRLSGYGVARLYVQSRNPAFQRIAHGRGRCIVEDLAADFRDGCRERTARLRAVTDHHHFIHQRRAFGQRHVDLRPDSYLFPALVVTDIREDQRIPGLRPDPEISGGIGRRPDHRTVDQHGDADKRQSVRAFHLSGYG